MTWASFSINWPAGGADAKAGSPSTIATSTDSMHASLFMLAVCVVAGWRCVKRSLSCGCQVQGPSGSGRRYGERPAPLPRLCVYGMIRTPKVTTADWNGVRVPMLALMVPLLPAAGALMEPTVVAAGAEPPEPVW